MSRTRRPWKVVVAFLVAAIIPLAMMGCGGSDAPPSGEQQPSEDHPSSEHPK